MSNHNEQRTSERENEHRLNLDGIITTQPELGPSIPDGGCGWIVFIGTLFFQALIPCMIVNMGVFLAFSKLEHGTSSDKNVILWEDKILYVPLFFSIARSFFDALTRRIVPRTATPRLIAVCGTCLTCAGLLFMWMGITGEDDDWLYIPAGISSGLGASFLMVQCELLVSQYFRLKLPVLNQISQFVVTMGFLLAPIALGQHILNTNISQVLLWYQAIILQGLVVGLVFRKPAYLKSKNVKPYQFVLTNPEDEEDIFSKNSRELQIKRQTSTETKVSKIKIDEPQPSTSNNTEEHKPNKEWEKFDEDNDNNVKYEKLNDWEVFDDDDDNEVPKKQKWEHFEDDGQSSPRIVNSLSLAEETKFERNNSVPSSLFSDMPVNNNNTYAYDDEIVAEPANSNVFVPSNTNVNTNWREYLNPLKEPTFYKSLLTIIANTYSFFMFYALFPSYLYIEADSVNIRHMTGLIGALSLVNLLFLTISYWINIDKKKKPICLWIFYWIGSVGYFMISDFTNEYVLLVGAIQVALSISALQYFGKPLLGISVKGETTPEYTLLTVLSSLALFIFIFIYGTFRDCFRMMAVMHFFVGTLWLSNFAFRRIRSNLK